MWAKAGLEVRVLLLSFFYKRWPEGISSAPSLCSLQHSTASRRTRIMHYAPTNELAKGPKQHQGILQKLVVTIKSEFLHKIIKKYF